MATENFEEFDVLGFSEGQFTEANKEKELVRDSGNIYRPRPEDSKAKDGVYRSKIKPIYNPFNLKQSYLERISYWLEDADGGFEVVSSLTNGDKECPLFKAWKKCRYSKDPGLFNQQETKDKGGNELFNRRYAKFIPIQVLEDENHPELVGKYMLWKCPKAIWDKMEGKQHPSEDSGKCPIPILDFLFGKAIELEIVPGPGPKGSDRYRRETSYASSELTEETVSCVAPDGSSILTPDQQDVLDEYVTLAKKVWKEKDIDKRAELQNALNGSDAAKKLRVFYRDVLSKIKEWCPNLVEEMEFKPWSADVTKRVNDWITIVLDKKDPAVDGVSSTKKDGKKDGDEGRPVVPDTTPTEPVDVKTTEDDDLPF